MKLSVANDNTVFSLNLQENCGFELVVESSGLKQVLSFDGPIAIRCERASVRSSQASMPQTTEKAPPDPANDNRHWEQRKLNRRKGRIWSSASRRIRRIRPDITCHREAITALADTLPETANEVEMLVRIHNKDREKRVAKLRAKCITRWDEEGKTNKHIAQLLNVSTVHLARLRKALLAPDLEYCHD